MGCSPWRVTKSRAQQSDFTFTFHFHALEKELATHSSVLAWRIPGMGEQQQLLGGGPGLRPSPPAMAVFPAALSSRLG